MILKLTIWLKRGIKYDLNWNSGGSGGWWVHGGYKVRGYKVEVVRIG